MMNYILADIRRVGKKQSFLFTLLGFITMYLLMIFILKTPDFNEAAYISKTSTFFGFFPLFIGLSIFLSIYYDDFKSKAMQVAIGYGISRNKVILTKIIDVIILSLVSGIVLGAITLIIAPMLGLALTGAQVLTLVTGFVVEVLRIIGYASLSTILVYFLQNAMIGTIIYVLLSSSTIMIILSILLGQEFIINIVGDVRQYLLTNVLHTQMANFIHTGSVGFVLSLVLIIYLVLPVFVSMFLFRKKELEF